MRKEIARVVFWSMSNRGPNHSESPVTTRGGASCAIHVQGSTVLLNGKLEATFSPQITMIVIGINFTDACSYEATEDGSGIKATKRGRKICREKCKKENDEYVEFLNGKLQELIGLLAEKEGIVAVLEPDSSKISQCVPRMLLTGLDCSCKSNFKIKVNSKLQQMFNDILSGRKSEVKDYGERGYPEHHHYSFFTKLVGFLIVLYLAFPLSPVYLIWWIFFS